MTSPVRAPWGLTVAILVGLAFPTVLGAQVAERQILGVVEKIVPEPRKAFAIRAATGRMSLIEVSSETRFLKGEGAASLDDVQLGTNVMATVHGRMASEVILDVFEVVVTHVRSLPSRQIDVKPTHGTPFVVALDDRTIIVKGQRKEPGRLSEVKENSLVVLRLAKDGPVPRALEILVPSVGGVVGGLPYPAPPPRPH
jgi:hypothetical protein